ncbi:MAG: hypothetical protein AB4060_22380, partial [Crocosphaera sp.]
KKGGLLDSEALPVNNLSSEYRGSISILNLDYCHPYHSEQIKRESYFCFRSPHQSNATSIVNLIKAYFAAH